MARRRGWAGARGTHLRFEPLERRELLSVNRVLREELSPGVFVERTYLTETR
jgi:hypothetical protein